MTSPVVNYGPIDLDDDDYIEARALSSKGNFQAAKECYDNYLYIHPLWFLEKNNDIKVIDALTDEYIDLLIKLHNLDISESNNLYQIIDQSIKQFYAISINHYKNTGSRMVLTHNSRESLTPEQLDLVDLLSASNHNDKISRYTLSEIERGNHFLLNYFPHINSETVIDNKYFLFDFIQKKKDFVEVLEANLIKKLIFKNWHILHDIVAFRDTYSFGLRGNMDLSNIEDAYEGYADDYYLHDE